jgi:uncharacterized peroxidase-related enzyme
MFLQPPPETETTSRFYKSDLDQSGYVMNLSRAWAWRPEVCEGFAALRMQLMSKTALSPRELAVVVCATAASLGDSYCALAWGNKLATAADATTAAAVLQGAQTDGLAARERALSAWTRQLTQDPNATRAEDVETLRAAGLSDQDIFDATVFAAFRLAFSTINDALGVQPDWQLAAAAPPEVRKAVSYGRAAAERQPP